MNDLHALIFPELNDDDPRLSGLPLSTQLYVTGHYGGDIVEAIRHANHAVNTQINPPQWALDIVGPRKGWADPIHGRIL